MPYWLPPRLALGPCGRDWTSPASYQPRPSPTGSLSFSLGGSAVKLCYGQPSARGREIFGALVPWEQPWRTGANEPTRIFTAGAIRVAGVALEPGRYSLYTVPGPETWTIALNRSTFHWGNDFSAGVVAQDVGRGTARAEPLPQRVETMAFSVEPRSVREAVLLLNWDRTRVRIPIER